MLFSVIIFSGNELILFMKSLVYDSLNVHIRVKHRKTTNRIKKMDIDCLILVDTMHCSIATLLILLHRSSDTKTKNGYLLVKQYVPGGLL